MNYFLSIIERLKIIWINLKQARSHEIWSGTVGVGGYAAKGMGIEARSVNHFAQSAEKIFTFIFESSDGLSWHLHALKTKIGHFETILSIILSSVATWLPTGLSPNSRILAEMWVVASKSGRVEIQPTRPVTTVLLSMDRVAARRDGVSGSDSL